MALENDISLSKRFGIAAMVVGALAFGAGEFKSYDSRAQISAQNGHQISAAFVEAYTSQENAGEYASAIGKMSFALGVGAYVFSAFMSGKQRMPSK